MIIKIKARNEKIRQHWANGRYDNIDNPGFSGRTHSKQVRKLISAGKKRWIENNPRLHWELTFGQKDSIPCRQLKEWLKSNGFIFEQEVRLIPGRKIQVDILFREIKLIVEVNGNQHYDSNGKLLPYYHSRHQLLLDAGWRVLELHYSTVFNHELVASLIENLSAKSCVFPIAKPT